MFEVDGKVILAKFPVTSEDLFPLSGHPKFSLLPQFFSDCFLVDLNGKSLVFYSDYFFQSVDGHLCFLSKPQELVKINCASVYFVLHFLDFNWFVIRMFPTPHGFRPSKKQGYYEWQFYDPQNLNIYRPGTYFFNELDPPKGSLGSEEHLVCSQCGGSIIARGIGQQPFAWGQDGMHQHVLTRYVFRLNQHSCGPVNVA
jgi:hypothetical protein